MNSTLLSRFLKINSSSFIKFGISETSLYALPYNLLNSSFVFKWTFNGAPNRIAPYAAAAAFPLTPVRGCGPPGKDTLMAGLLRSLERKKALNKYRALVRVSRSSSLASPSRAPHPRRAPRCTAPAPASSAGPCGPCRSPRTRGCPSARCWPAPGRSSGCPG